MCKYVVNSITFSSRNNKLLRELHKKVLKCYDGTANGKNLVKDLMKEHGYLLPLGVNNTDRISNCDEFITKKKGTYFFQCETVTAWEDNMIPIIRLLKEKYLDNIHLSFRSEDSCELFLVKDETGVFYPEKFKVEWRVGERCEVEYFATFHELFIYLQETFTRASFSYYDSISDISNSIGLMYEDPDKEYYFNIYRFNEYHNAMADYFNNKEVA